MELVLGIGGFVLALSVLTFAAWAMRRLDSLAADRSAALVAAERERGSRQLAERDVADHDRDARAAAQVAAAERARADFLEGEITELETARLEDPHVVKPTSVTNDVASRRAARQRVLQALDSAAGRTSPSATGDRGGAPAVHPDAPT